MIASVFVVAAVIDEGDNSKTYCEHVIDIALLHLDDDATFC